MKEVKWNESLSVGVDLIDEQHKTWIEHLNEVSKALETQQGPVKAGKTLDFLIEYTHYHFGTEEKNMEAHNYPGMAEHKMKHEEFKKTLSDLEDEFREDGATHILADSIDTLLVNWLMNHIEVVDQKFGAFLKENGIVISE